MPPSTSLAGVKARKVAGRAYAEASAPMSHLANEPELLGASSILNRENLLRLLDNAIVSLEEMRGDIDAKDQAALNERLKNARVRTRNLVGSAPDGQLGRWSGRGSDA